MMPSANWTRGIIFAFAGAIFLIATITGKSIDQNGYRWAGMVISGVILALTVFERWAWRWPLVQRLSVLAGTPLLHGTWVGKLNFERNANGKPGSTNFYMVINQTFTTVSVRSFFGELTKSQSYSVVSTFERTIPGRMQLVFTYRSEALYSQREKNRPHDGTAVLNIISDTNTMEGGYFTERGGAGTMELRKISSEPAKSYVQAMQLAEETMK
jgi:hypothetical protein